jgi:hypothetical protein
MKLYSEFIEWTDFNGEKIKVKVYNRLTEEEAILDVIEEAKAFGWTYPKWYQYWRIFDTRPDKKILKKLNEKNSKRN